MKKTPVDERIELEKEELKMERTEYNMKLNDTLSFSSGVTKMIIMRVPGGWIYTTILDFGSGEDKITPIASSVFVPMHEPKTFERIPNIPDPQGPISV